MINWTLACTYVALMTPLLVHADSTPARPNNLLPTHVRNQLPQQAVDIPSLLVVHTTTAFDSEGMAATAVDALVREFKDQQRPVIYLVNDQTDEGYHRWYTKDRSPDYEIFSEGGEHNLPLISDEVTVVGGFFGSYDSHNGCQTLAVRDAIRMHFELSDRPFTVHLPVPALYFYEDDRGLREKLLTLDPVATPATTLQKIFASDLSFADQFFLRDTEGEVLEFGHTYPGGKNMNYRPGGHVNVEGYTFELFFGEQSVLKFGQGPKKVNLKLL